MMCLENLVFCACDRCQKEVPQYINSCLGYFELICTVCANSKRYGRCIQCVQCGNFIEAVGFVVANLCGGLVVFRLGSGIAMGEERKYCTILRVIWCSEPVDHESVCGKLIDVAKK